MDIQKALQMFREFEKNEPKPEEEKLVKVGDVIACALLGGIMAAGVFMLSQNPEKYPEELRKAA